MPRNDRRVITNLHRQNRVIAKDRSSEDGYESTITDIRESVSIVGIEQQRQLFGTEHLGFFELWTRPLDLGQKIYCRELQSLEDELVA